MCNSISRRNQHIATSWKRQAFEVLLEGADCLGCACAYLAESSWHQLRGRSSPIMLFLRCKPECRNNHTPQRDFRHAKQVIKLAYLGEVEEDVRIKFEGKDRTVASQRSGKEIAVNLPSYLYNEIISSPHSASMPHFFVVLAVAYRARLDSTSLLKTREMVTFTGFPRFLKNPQHH